MINHVVLVGRITADPELQQTSQGISYVRFTIACDRQFKDQAGNKTADFINCIAWRQQAEFMSQYIHKGNVIGVEGRIQVSKYTDSNGANRNSFDIYVDTLTNIASNANRDSRPNFEPEPPFVGGGNTQKSYDAAPVEPKPQQSTEFEVAEDDLPF